MYYKGRKEAEIRDPFEDLLVLSEQMLKRVSKMQVISLFGATGGLIAGSILLLVGIWLAAYSSEDLGLIGFSIAGGLASLAVCVLSFQINEFLIYFEKRMDTLLKARNFNPNPRVPPGASGTDRIIGYLTSSSRELAAVLERRDDRWVKPASFRVAGATVSFDASFTIRRIRAPNIFILIRELSTLTTDNLRMFKTDVERVTRRKRLPPTRAIVVSSGTTGLADWVADWIDANWLLYPSGAMIGKELHSCPVEVFQEMPNGTYDLGVIYVG